MFMVKNRFAKILVGALDGLSFFLVVVLVGFSVFLAGVLAGFVVSLAGALAGILLEIFIPKRSRAFPCPSHRPVF